MNSTRYQYDDLARPLKIKRWGVIDSDGETEKFGLLDDLTFEYDGARLSGYGQNPDTYEGEEFFQRVSMPMATATRQYSKGRLSKENGIGDIFYAYNRRGQPKATVSVVAGFPYTETSLVKTHDCHGRLMAKTGTVKQGKQGSIAFDRRYVEGFTFNNGQLERVDFTGGYFDAQGDPHYLLTDRLGSVVLVVSGDCEVEARYGYYPYGEMWRNASGQQRRLAAKERETIAVPGDYCFGPRTYRPGLTLWDTADRYNSQYPWLSPFTYCAANPVNFIDPTGNNFDVIGQKALYSWRLENGVWGLFDGAGVAPPKSDKFAWAAFMALREIWNTKIGRYIMLELINSECYGTISNLYNHPAYRNGDAHSSKGGETGVLWDFKGSYIPTSSGLRKNRSAELFHELVHVYLCWNKLRNDETWLTLPQKVGFKTVTKSDIYVTHFENIFRKERGYPLRTHYAYEGDHFSDFIGQILNIDDGTSLYFDINGNTNFELLPDDVEPYKY